MNRSPIRRQSERGREREAAHRALCIEVKARDGYRCSICATHLGVAGGQVHHAALRHRLSRELSNHPAMLAYLCPAHHARAHTDAALLDELLRDAVERLTDQPCVGDPMETLRRIERGVA